jgi:ligand-binding sensor domain-containing protein
MACRNREIFKLQVVFCLVFCLCLCTILSIHSSAQAREVPAKSLAALADARRMIVHNGCVWVAGGGLTRYYISKNSANQYVTEQGLVANAVFDVAVDKKNQVLWAATSSGLGKLDLQTNQWKSFGRTEGLFEPFVLSLCVYHRQGETFVFIGTRTDGLFFLREGSAKITRAVDKKKIPDPWVSSIAVDHGHNYLWIGTASGVVRCKLSNHNHIKIDPLPCHNQISAKRLVVDERAGDVFCLNYYHEIFHYRSSEKSWEKIPPPGEDIEIADLFLESASSLLWAAADNGIYRFKLKQKQWIRHPGYRGNVFCITLDPKNHVFYYAAREGIRSTEMKEKKSRLVLSNSPPFNNTVNAIFIDEKSDMIWVGTDWGIARFKKKTRQWKFFDLPPFLKERVLALSVDDNSVWFGTMHHGAGKMDRKTGKIEEIKGTPGDSTVTSLIGDKEKRKVWFGLLGTRGGVYEYNIEKKKLKVLPFLDGVSVTFLLEDGDWIWVGTGMGVAKFHKLKGLGANPFDPRLAFGGVLTLAFDNKRDLLWITTEYEVIVYDGTRKQHKIFKGAGGFPRSPITAILFDGEHIWLGSEGYGLYLYSPLEGIKNPLTRMKGTADRYIISLAHDKKQRNIWAGTVSGGISVIRRGDK